MSAPLQIFYLSNERFPATLACTIQQMVMCEAFAKTGARVELVCPFYHDTPRLSPHAVHEFYGVDSNFAIRRIFSLLSLSKPKQESGKRRNIPFIGGWSILISTWIYALKLWLNGRFDQPTAIYSRNVNSAFVFLKLKKSLWRRKNIAIFFEVHSLDQQYPRRFFHRLLRESDGLVCISTALRTALTEKFGIESQKILVVPDGVRASLLKPAVDKAEARRQLGFFAEKIVLYSGQLWPGKGADLFVEAATFFDDDVLFLLVGGHGDYLTSLQEKIEQKKLTNVRLTGFVPPATVPLYQVAADVLVLPPTADHAISPYTSPLKLFEYMAARRPIVASDLPVLQEVLADGKNALLFQERKTADLAAKIKTLLEHEALGEKLAARAFQDVHDYTWEARAVRVIEFMQKNGAASTR